MIFLLPHIQSIVRLGIPNPIPMGTGPLDVEKGHLSRYGLQWEMAAFIRLGDSGSQRYVSIVTGMITIFYFLKTQRSISVENT